MAESTQEYNQSHHTPPRLFHVCSNCISGIPESFLSTITSSTDQSIRALTPLSKDRSFLDRQNIPQQVNCYNLSREEKSTTKSALVDAERTTWIEHLQRLQVQNKSLETIDLEEKFLESGKELSMAYRQISFHSYSEHAQTCYRHLSILQDERFKHSHLVHYADQPMSLSTTS